MTNVIKFRMLYGMILMTYREWQKEIGSKDLDDPFCCSGLDFYGQTACGCHGKTVREWYGYLLTKKDRNRNRRS